MNIKRSPAIGALLAVALASSGARATTSCTFSTVVGVAFGGYDVFATSPLDTTGGLTFSCQGVTGGITIHLSRGYASSYTNRTMRRGAVDLRYNLFLDAPRSLVWGDGTGGTSFYATTPTSNVDVTVPIYGRLFAQQSVPAGSYGDVIIATINF